MEYYRIILIDAPPNIKLLQESLLQPQLRINIQCVSTLKDAINSIKANAPDLIIVGSAFIIMEGFQAFLNLGSFPIAVLCESYGLHRFLKDSTKKVCFITRPFDIDRIPDIINQAIEFMISCKESKDVFTKN